MIESRHVFAVRVSDVTYRLTTGACGWWRDATDGHVRVGIVAREPDTRGKRLDSVTVRLRNGVPFTEPGDPVLPSDIYDRAVQALRSMRALPFRPAYRGNRS